MTSRRLLVALAMTACLFARPVSAEHRSHHRYHQPDVSGMQKVHREIRLDHDGSVEMKLEFDAGSLRVTRGEKPGVVVLDLYQEADADTAKIEFDRGRESQSLRRDQRQLEVGRPRRPSVSFSNDSADSGDDDDDTGGHHDGDQGPRRVWEIALPPDLRFDLDLASGASHNELDFSGIRLHDLHLATGAGEMEMRFESPNPDPGGTLPIEGGACEFSALGLGNARFRSIQFQGGVGDFLLDFRGKSAGDTRGELTLGMGRLRAGTALLDRRELDCAGGALSHLDVDGLVRHGDTYRSEGYEDAHDHLVLELSASLGLVEVAVEE